MMEEGCSRKGCLNSTTARGFMMQSTQSGFFSKTEPWLAERCFPISNGGTLLGPQIIPLMCCTLTL